MFWMQPEISYKSSNLGARPLEKLRNLPEMCLVASLVHLSCCNKMGGLTSRNLFLTILEADKYKIKVLNDQVPHEDSLCL